MKTLLLMLFFLNACFYPINPSYKNPQIRVLKNNNIIKISLEKYVAHVLAGEVSFNWPKEALKAQAIAIRTYALKKMQENKNKKFDVQATVVNQVFKDTTHENFIEAALSTKGLVMKDQHNLVEASFHSTCGGHTASAKSVFGREYSYLQSKSCSYCEKSPSFNWTVSVPLSSIEQTFNINPKSIKINEKQGVRAKNLILTQNNKNISVKAHDFRMKISPMKVKSTYITDVSIKGSDLHIQGHGFGHGVGMCQYGAKEMASKGKNFKNILSYYYKNISINKIY